MENDSPYSLPTAPDLTETDLEAVERDDAVEYSPETDTYRASFGVDTDPLWTAVVSTIAVVSETDPTDLPPLYSVIDPATLEDLIEQSGPGPPSSDVSVSFTYGGYAVTVHSYGIIAVRPV